MNWPNVPARDGKSTLRRSIKSPRGTTLVACDSSNIELRVNMALAGQFDVLAALRSGEDLYCTFATDFFGRPVTKADKMERMLGKVAMLGLGYGMGPDKFRTVARLMGGLTLTPEEAERAVRLYRGKYAAVRRWWQAWDSALPTLASGRMAPMHEIVNIAGGKIQFPTGMPLQYPDLRQEADGEWTLAVRNGRAKTYGAKIVENITQAVARNIVMEQTLTIAARYPVVLSVHDEVVFLCRRGDERDAAAFAVGVMSTSPEWFPDIPLAAEASYADNYGDCK
jgi:DNA polymerase